MKKKMDGDIIILFIFFSKQKAKKPTFFCPCQSYCKYDKIDTNLQIGEQKC